MTLLTMWAKYKSIAAEIKELHETEKALINNEIQGITFKYQLAKYIQGEQGNIYNFF